MGYRRVPIVFQLQSMAHASRWLGRAGLGADALTSEVVERFLAERRAAGYTNYVTARAMAPLLGYLRGLGVAPAASPRLAVGAVEVLLADYREYLAVERGLTADTVEGYVLAVRPFLDGRLRDGDELDLAGLSAAEVVAFVVARCPACPPVGVRVSRHGRIRQRLAAVGIRAPVPVRVAARLLRPSDLRPLSLVAKVRVRRRATIRFRIKGSAVAELRGASRRTLVVLGKATAPTGDRARLRRNVTFSLTRLR